MIPQEEFMELINDFVDNNFRVFGVSEGTEAEVGVDDYKGSYKKASNELYNAVFSIPNLKLSEGIFGEIIEPFIDENFVADGCKECHQIGHSIVPQDHKGSYEKALKELFSKLGIKRDVPQLTDIDEYLNRVPKEDVEFNRVGFLDKMLEGFFNGKITINELQQKFKKYTDLRDV